jgi:hypothetical protein
MLFNKVSYRRGIIEGLIIYTLGRLGALITPAFFPDWLFVAVPLLFLLLMYIIPPVWTARRMTSTKRERLSRRFLLLGPLMALLALVIDFIIDLVGGLATGQFEAQQGPILVRFSASGAQHLSLVAYGIYELRTAITLLALYTIAVVCTRLAGGGFLKFTMPAGGNRVTL